MFPFSGVLAGFVGAFARWLGFLQVDASGGRTATLIGVPAPSVRKPTVRTPLEPSFWERWATKRSRFGGMCGNIAQNYGVHAAVDAMFAAKLAYFAQ